MSEEQSPTQKTPLTNLKPKMALQGKVTRIELSGAVVDVGAEREGLLHISAMGRDAVHQVKDVLQVGQEIKVWIRKVDSRKGELQLTMVQPLAFEWNDLKPGQIVHGTITRVEQFGVFVDFGAERPGMIHVSELANEYVRDTASVVRVGEEVDAVVLEINKEKRQVRLSRKALEAREQAEAQEEVRASEPEVKTVTAMEAAFLRAQSGEPEDILPEKPSRRSSAAKIRRQQEEILNRTLGTAPKK
jgi:small subunit ribosomal protein S1